MTAHAHSLLNYHFLWVEYRRGPNLKLFEQKLVILHIQIMFHLVSVYIDYCSVTISNPNIALCFFNLTVQSNFELPQSQIRILRTPIPY